MMMMVMMTMILYYPLQYNTVQLSQSNIQMSQSDTHLPFLAAFYSTEADSSPLVFVQSVQDVAFHFHWLPECLQSQPDVHHTRACQHFLLVNYS